MIRTVLFFLVLVISTPVLVYSQPGDGQQGVTAITKMTLYHNGVSGGENVDRIYDCVRSNKIGFTAEAYCKNTANHAMQYKLEWKWYRYKWSQTTPPHLVMVQYGSAATDPVTVAANGDVTFVADKKDVGTFLPIDVGQVTVTLRLVSRPVGNSGAWLDEAARSGHYHQGPYPTAGPGQGGPGM